MPNLEFTPLEEAIIDMLNSDRGTVYTAIALENRASRETAATRTKDGQSDYVHPLFVAAGGYGFMTVHRALVNLADSGVIKRMGPESSEFRALTPDDITVMPTETPEPAAAPEPAAQHDRRGFTVTITVQQSGVHPEDQPTSTRTGLTLSGVLRYLADQAFTNNAALVIDTLPPMDPDVLRRRGHATRALTGHGSFLDPKANLFIAVWEVELDALTVVVGSTIYNVAYLDELPIGTILVDSNDTGYQTGGAGDIEGREDLEAPLTVLWLPTDTED